MGMLLVGVCFLAAFVWFGVTVELGDHTLFGHLRAISGSKESQELWRGTKAKVNDALGIEKAKAQAKEALKAAGEKVERLKDKAGADDNASGKTMSAPQDQIGDGDREAMRRLIGSAHADNSPRAPKTK